MSNGPLNISLSIAAVKTTIPVIVDGHMVKAKLKDISQTTNEKGDSLKFEWNLVDPAPTTEGGQVQPGFPIFENVTLYDKNTEAGAVPSWALEKISKRVDAVLGTGDEGNKKNKPVRPEFNGETVASMIGREAVLKLKAKTGDYTGNDVSAVYFPGDLAGA